MTHKRTFTYLALGLIALAAVGGFVIARSFSANETTVLALARETHFHGIAVDPRNADRIYLATHHGVFAVAPDGTARRISETRDDFMGFTPHPADPAVLYASGHPAGGGNLGFIVSRDGGASWSKLADGVGGPVDFHQMHVSKANPKVIYGVHGDLQKSTDGGRTWARIGPPPEGIIDLAASGRDQDTVYAATQQGLLKSTDGGRSWKAAHVLRRPATMVQVTRGTEVYAFVVGTGLIRASEENLRWHLVSDGFGGNYILHLAAAPDSTQQLYVVTYDPNTRAQAIFASRDGGANWITLGVE